MLPPLIQRPRRSDLNRQRERGVTLALVAVAIFSIVAMAGLSIDVGTLYQASAEAQRAADAAALAAAQAISASGITGAATPTADNSSWQKICGGASSIATETAVAVAQQNTVGGASLPAASIRVTYSAANGAVSPGSADCSTVSSGFGVNPVVTVQVTQTSLRTYFSRIWGRTGSSVSATASAEALNPSNSDSYASNSGVVPVQPRCVKPWMVPNLDPVHTPLSFVALANGSITTQGILAAGSGVIGETFWLMPDCHHNRSTCVLRSVPQANYSQGGNSRIPPLPNLDYLPAQASYPSTAIPSDGSDACSAVSGDYAQAIAGCDQSTQYQCGKLLQNEVDLGENPGLGDTTNG